MKAEVAAIVTLFLLDFVWLMVNAKRFDTLVKSVQGSGLRMNYTGAILSYTSIVLLFLFVAFPMARTVKSRSSSYSRAWIALTTGGVLGATSYAMLHATNMAIFKGYGGIVPILDTIWGGVLFTLVVYVYLSLI